jgi:hypothetical protein
VLLAMEPGKQGEPWWLCTRCWFDGVRSSKNTTEQSAPAPVVVEPEKKQRKRKAG